MAAEHVAPHHRGADVGERLLDDRRAFVDLSAFKAVHRAPGRERNDPLVQAHAADPERVLHALAGTGNKAVERHRDLEAQLGHVSSSMSVRCSTMTETSSVPRDDLLGMPELPKDRSIERLRCFHWVEVFTKECYLAAFRT